MVDKEDEVFKREFFQIRLNLAHDCFSQCLVYASRVIKVQAFDELLGADRTGAVIVKVPIRCCKSVTGGENALVKSLHNEVRKLNRVSREANKVLSDIFLFQLSHRSSELFLVQSEDFIN